MTCPSDVIRTEEELVAKALGATNVFPVSERRSDYEEVLDHAQPGISLRRLFAAMALQGIRAGGATYPSEQAAEGAVEDADALLRELSK